MQRLRNSSYRISGAGYPTYTYHEGTRKITIWVEGTIGNSKGALAIFASGISSWDPPHNDEVISDSKRMEILDRLGEYLKKRHRTFWLK